MTQFKVGGKVVCVKDGVSNNNTSGERFVVKKGGMYDVLDIKVCSCGSVSIDVGIRKKPTTATKQTSECCKCHIRIETLVVWAHTSLFLPIEEQEFKQVTYTSILESIPAGSN